MTHRNGENQEKEVKDLEAPISLTPDQIEQVAGGLSDVVSAVAKMRWRGIWPEDVATVITSNPGDGFNISQTIISKSTQL